MSNTETVRNAANGVASSLRLVEELSDPNKLFYPQTTVFNESEHDYVYQYQEAC